LRMPSSAWNQSSGFPVGTLTLMAKSAFGASPADNSLLVTDPLPPVALFAETRLTRLRYADVRRLT
jgi:hypothetical protein